MISEEMLLQCRGTEPEINGKLFTEVFGADYTLNELLIEEKLSPREIVDSITAYEAAKKAPKPIEIEWVDICRIIQIQDNGFKKCVYEEELDNHLIPFSEGDKFAMKSAEGILKKYISENEGRYIAIIEYVCRAKEDK